MTFGWSEAGARLLGVPDGHRPTRARKIAVESQIGIVIVRAGREGSGAERERLVNPDLSGSVASPAPDAPVAEPRAGMGSTRGNLRDTAQACDRNGSAAIFERTISEPTGSSASPAMHRTVLDERARVLLSDRDLNHRLIDRYALRRRIARPVKT